MHRIETAPDQQRRELLRESLRETNSGLSAVMRAMRGTAADSEVPVEIYALEDERPGGSLIGGLVGHAWARWLHIGLLWVDERQRGGKLGSRLMAEAERQAREDHGCLHSRVETFDFQAPGFYQKLGYTLVGKVEDYPPGCTDHLLVKRL
ncbi:MAG TPA: GNAT family N-acetyltransferase [Streptomyces sp.]|jgi:GNAT superfamily N-acetyltransferase|nr:GNAT family N-acetyltransferase [Streptomyces sp.]